MLIKKCVARWRGPGIVADSAGCNFSVAMPGAFIKCSPDQLRLRTKEEREADRFSVRDLRPAAMQLYPEVGISGRTQKQIMDITQEDMPPGDLLPGPEPASVPDSRPEPPEVRINNQEGSGSTATIVVLSRTYCLCV